jgi:hypothetical protein
MEEVIDLAHNLTLAFFLIAVVGMNHKTLVIHTTTLEITEARFLLPALTLNQHRNNNRNDSHKILSDQEKPLASHLIRVTILTVMIVALLVEEGLRALAPVLDLALLQPSPTQTFAPLITKRITQCHPPT